MRENALPPTLPQRSDARDHGAAGATRLLIASAKRQFERQNLAGIFLLFAGAVAFPFLPGVGGWMASQAALVVLFIVAAQGVSILTGYTGLVTVGHGGFFAIGAYTAALFSHYVVVDLAASIVLAALIAGLIGFALGLIFLRLSGAFLAIGTLGFAFFVGTIVNNVPVFHGRDGIFIEKNHILGFALADRGFYLVALGTLALTTLFIFCLVNSAVGRALMALRDAEKAAESCGVNRLLYRTLAFALSAAITGIAGALSAHLTGYVSAEDYKNIWYSVDILVATVVGGSALMMGPFVGGAFIVMVPFFLEEMADFAFILKGAVLIAVLLLAPAGVADLLARPIRAFRRRKLEKIAADPSSRSSGLPTPRAAGGLP
jgi:ABC-type branched-subunit amino acid transport system permease subunit